MNQRTLLRVIAVTGTLLLSGYGNAESQAQQPPLTNKTISLKGIPLGKPGVTDALKKMCVVKKFNTMNDRCSFMDRKSMVLVDYETLANAFALITLSGDGALVNVSIDGSTQEMLTLAKALEKKYGKPLKKNTVIKKEIGTQLDTGNFVVKESEGNKLDKATFIWIDGQGTRITVESVYSDYDKGGVVIEASSVTAQDTTEKKAK